MINPNTFDLLSDLIYWESTLGLYRQYVDFFYCAESQFLGYLLFSRAARAKYCNYKRFYKYALRYQGGLYCKFLV